MAAVVSISVLLSAPSLRRLSRIIITTSSRITNAPATSMPSSTMPVRRESWERAASNRSSSALK
ncbi:hypothetical protein ACVWXM_008869 [Bradyrhizobium sp. GM7.3]